MQTRPDSLVAAKSSPASVDELVVMHLVDITPDGRLVARDAKSDLHRCDCVSALCHSRPVLEPGERILVAVPGGGADPVVIDRIGRYVSPEAQTVLKLSATEAVTLQCGESSLTLRADGKVMLKGEDVLLRAKGTQRIRAGTVAIN